MTEADREDSAPAMADLLDELEIVVLIEDVPAEDTFGGEPYADLHAGMRGTVVYVHYDSKKDIPLVYTVEFKTESGGSYPYHHHLADLRPDQVRRLREEERS